MGLIKALREEMPVIRQAPWAIGSSVLILTAAAAVVIYALFSADLSAKTSLINTLTGQVAALQREVETLKSGAKTDPPPNVQTRPEPAKRFAPATPKVDRSVKIGNKNEFTNSPIVTGDGNTVNVNPIAPPRKLTKEQEDRLEALVKSIGPHEIAFRHSPGNDDAQQFADQLQGVIVTRGGWKSTRPKFLIAQREVYGVWVFVQSADAPPPAATMLLDALNDKFLALGAKGIEVPDLAPGSIDLMVGLPEKK